MEMPGSEMLVRTDSELLHMLFEEENTLKIVNRPRGKNLNPFTSESLTWTLPSLTWTLPSMNLDMSINTNKGLCLKLKNRMTNSLNPDETARYEQYHLNPHCLQVSILVCQTERVKVLSKHILVWSCFDTD